MSFKLFLCNPLEKIELNDDKTSRLKSVNSHRYWLLNNFDVRWLTKSILIKKTSRQIITKKIILTSTSRICDGSDSSNKRVKIINKYVSEISILPITPDDKCKEIIKIKTDMKSSLKSLM